MEEKNLNKKVEKIIEVVKKLRVVTYDEVLQAENEEQSLLDDCVWVTPFVFIYNAGNDLFIIQNYYVDSLEKCNTTYLMAYLKEELKKWKQ